MEFNLEMKDFYYYPRAMYVQKSKLERNRRHYYFDESITLLRKMIYENKFI